MRITRPALALALTASFLATGVASAAKKPAPKPVCNLVTDDAGDAGIVTAQDGMDILSADVASNASSIKAVIRLKSAPAKANPQAPGGTNYYFNFTAPGATNVQYFTAAVPFTGDPTFATGEVAGTAGQNVSTDDAPNGTTGSIVGNVISISAPLSSLTRVTVKPGTKLTDLGVEARALIGAMGTGDLVLADDATGAKPYIAGAKSCVKP